MPSSKAIPVITIDGPSASGKSTASRRLAQALGWYWLNSGMIYRAVAYCAYHAEVPLFEKGEEACVRPDQVEKTVNGLVDFIQTQCLLHLKPSPQSQKDGTLFWKNCPIKGDLYAPQWAEYASLLSAHLPVRSALLDLQRQFARFPGLVADGRDMGTVVFPDANPKFFLRADAAVRAQRRFMQLQCKGIHVSLGELKKALEARDQRDQDRAVSPLVPAKGACILDTGLLSSEAVLARMLSEIKGYNNGHKSESRRS